MAKVVVNTQAIDELYKRLDVAAIKSKVRAMMTALKSPFEHWDEFKTLIPDLVEVVTNTIKAVEAMAIEASELVNGGPQKLKTAAQFLDEMITFPLFIEWVDGFIFYILLSVVVSMLNKQYGHDWKNIIGEYFKK